MIKNTQSGVWMMTALALTCLAAATARAQDVAELPDAASILDRYVEVTGGIDAYEARQSQIVQGTMEMAAVGLMGSLTIYQDGDNYYTVVDLPGVGLIEAGVTDGIAWENSVLQGARIKQGTERAQAVNEARINATARWREIYPAVETTGVETVNGEETYRVVLNPADGPPVSMYFGIDSGLATRTEIVAATPMGDVPMQVSMSDYEDIGGILTPTSMTQNVAGQAIRMSFESAEINPEIPAERFALPEEVAALLE